jgi:hypothetical protein
MPLQLLMAKGYKMGHICLCCNANLNEDSHYSGCCCEEEAARERAEAKAAVKSTKNDNDSEVETPIMTWAKKLAAMSDHDITLMWDALGAYDPLSTINGMFADHWADLIYSEMSGRHIPIFKFMREADYDVSKV